MILGMGIEPAISRAEYARTNFDPADPPMYEAVLRHLKKFTSDRSYSLIETGISTKELLDGQVSSNPASSLFSRQSLRKRFSMFSSNRKKSSESLDKSADLSPDGVEVNAQLIAFPASDEKGPGELEHSYMHFSQAGGKAGWQTDYF